MPLNEIGTQAQVYSVEDTQLILNVFEGIMSYQNFQKVVGKTLLKTSKTLNLGQRQHS